MKQSRLHIVLLLLLLLILLPALLYTGYEFSRLNEAEQTLSMVYEQQLDAVLFSVNQYALDITGSWFADIQDALRRGDGETITGSALSVILQGQTPMRTLSLHDSAGTRIAAAAAPAQRSFLGRLTDSLAARVTLRSLLLRFREEEYLKIEPMLVPDDSARARLCLTAVILTADGTGLFAVISLESREFISRVIG
ncbi:MAG: hypothetical protein RRA94_16605, partial [Bacteroidota bacterium]|nr:hypothetical protein [Bacteroidota bacterium]